LGSDRDGRYKDTKGQNVTGSSYRGFVISLHEERLAEGNLTADWSVLVAGQAIYVWLQTPLTRMLPAMRNSLKTISDDPKVPNKTLATAKTIVNRLENLYQTDMLSFKRALNEAPDPRTEESDRDEVLYAIKTWADEINKMVDMIQELSKSLTEYQWIFGVWEKMLIKLHKDMVEVLAALDE
jgi:hypothetical protein